MAIAKYLVATNGDGSSIVYGAVRKDGQRPTAIPMRLKEAEALAKTWPVQGQVVIYKLVAVKNVWHDAPGDTPPKDQ